MRRLIVNTFLTLDGVMQAPGGPEEDPAGGFEHGGWSVPYWDDRMGEIMGAWMTPPFDIVLGRKTYEIFAAHWPHTDEPGAKELNEARQVRRIAHARVGRLAELRPPRPDVPAAIAALKEEDGPVLQVHGSADLLQTLIGHDLIDEFQLFTFPVVLGHGQAPLRRGHEARRASSSSRADLDHRSRRLQVPPRGRGQDGIVRARGADPGGGRAPGQARGRVAEAAERPRSRTEPATGYAASPVLKTGWATGPCRSAGERSETRAKKRGRLLPPPAGP